MKVLFAVSVCAQVACLSFVSPVLALPGDQDVFTGFEGISTTAPDPFHIGAVPEQASFSGDAFSGVLGQTALYFNGSFSWMIQPNGTGRIDFDRNAAVVEFWARTNPGASQDLTIRALNDAGQQLGGEVTLTQPEAWQLVSFAGNIDHILVDNPDAAMAAIDDFGFTSVPEPAAGVGLVALVLLAHGRLRRR